MTRLGWCLRLTILPRSPIDNHVHMVHMELVNHQHQPPLDGLTVQQEEQKFQVVYNFI